MSIKIITDSTADLPEEIVDKYGIQIVPAYLVLNGKTYRDGVDITPDEIYHHMVSTEQTITTSQPSPGDFLEVYRSALKNFEHIISIQATGRLSGIYSSAVSAKNMIEDSHRIRVIDSRLTSMGLGLLVALAGRLSQAGGTIDKIVTDVKTAIDNTHLWGSFDTLKYLYRGGRIGKAKALLGGMLNIKPVLTMREGEIFPIGFARTTNRAIDRLVDLASSIKGIQDVAVVHSTTPDEAKILKNRLSHLVFSKNISISRLGAGLGVHGGPGALIVAAHKKSEEPSESGTIEQVSDKKLFTFPQMPEIKLPKLRFALT